MIKVSVPNFDPKSITCDYEIAAFKNVSEIFPTVKIRGCFFHLTKNMKKLGELGLINRYNNEPTQPFVVRKNGYKFCVCPNRRHG